MNFPAGYLKLDEDVKCEICEKILPIHRFTNHPKMAHKISIKEYYDKYLKKEKDGLCLCGKPTKFFSLINGYRQFCSVKCLTKNISLVRGKEIIKHNEFICKICKNGFRTINGLSKHISIVHECNCKSYYDKYMKKDREGLCKICNKPTRYYDMGKGYNLYCSNACGTSDPDVQIKNKQAHFTKTGYNNPFQNPMIINKIRILNRKIREEKGDWLPNNQIPFFHLYYRLVSHYTYLSTQKKFTLEELYDRRQKGIQVDHKYSIFRGFKEGIVPWIIGSECNLEILSCKENLKKNIKCSISKEELFKLYEARKI